MLKVNLESCFKISVVSRNTFPFLRKRDTPTPRPISHESNNVERDVYFCCGWEWILEQCCTLHCFHDSHGTLDKWRAKVGDSSDLFFGWFDTIQGRLFVNADNGEKFKRNAGTFYEAIVGGSSIIQLWEGCGLGRAEAFLILRFHFPAPVEVALNAPLHTPPAVYHKLTTGRSIKARSQFYPICQYSI